MRHWHIITWLAGRRTQPTIGLTSGVGVPSQWAEDNGAYARAVTLPDDTTHIVGHWRCDDASHVPHRGQ